MVVHAGFYPRNGWAVVSVGSPVRVEFMAMPTLMAVIERDPESGWFIGRVPQVPGVHSQAPTLEELRPRLQEALRAVIADMLACGEELPET
jgi:predicted RNase H-like HicB family nuclease